MLFQTLDIYTKNPEKCRQDYLKIKVNGVAEFYCGTLNTPKLKIIGPWDKTRRIRIIFRSDNLPKNGQGVDILFWTGLFFLNP